jgi:hypothetical protein
VLLLFSPRFLRVLVNSLAHADAHLHAAAKRLTEQVLLRWREGTPAGACCEHCRML